jgi:hypothetical protein
MPCTKCFHHQAFEDSDSEDDCKSKGKKKRVTAREKDDRVHKTIDALNSKWGV